VGLTKTMKMGALVGALALSAVGCSDDDGDAANPLGGAATPSAPDNVEDLVNTLYGALADNDASTACALFSPSGQVEFIEGHDMPTCEAAVDSIAQAITDAEAFAHPTIELDDPNATEVDEYCGSGISVRVPDGAGDGVIAAFGYSQQPDGTWLVTSYSTSSCGG